MANDYRTYTIEAFALDASFRNWVLLPNAPEAAFWETWLVQHPDRLADVEQARTLLLTLHEPFQDDLTDDIIRQDVDRIRRQITPGRVQPLTRIRPLWPGTAAWWRVAAAVLLLTSAGWWLTRSAPADKPATVLLTDNRLISRTNTTDHPVTILLNDGSVVTLEKGSQLTFPNRFTGHTRPVSLTGEAFFDITKNARKPFLVFTRESVTRVVGTSFRVKATAGSPTVQVVVRTGRVAVYTKTAFEHPVPNAVSAPGAVVLTPNQQAVLTRKSGQLVKEPVSSPQAVAETIHPVEITFDDQPVADVLRSLERAYNIRFQFNETLLSNCRITTAFVDESLPERLSAICQAINATYQTSGDQITISGKGCQ